MDDTRNPTQDGQTDVDQEVGITSALQEDTQRRQDDGKDNFADITVDNLSTLDMVWFCDRAIDRAVSNRGQVDPGRVWCREGERTETTYEAVKGIVSAWYWRLGKYREVEKKGGGCRRREGKFLKGDPRALGHYIMPPPVGSSE